MDIVKRLRRLTEEWWECCGDIHEPLAEAADEIERLREALKPFAEIADDWDHLDDEDYVSVHKYDISVKHFRAIRSALQQKDSE